MEKGKCRGSCCTPEGKDETALPIKRVAGLKQDKQVPGRIF